MRAILKAVIAMIITWLYGCFAGLVLGITMKICFGSDVVFPNYFTLFVAQMVPVFIVFYPFGYFVAKRYKNHKIAWALFFGLILFLQQYIGTANRLLVLNSFMEYMVSWVQRSFIIIAIMAGVFMQMVISKRANINDGAIAVNEAVGKPPI